MLTKDEWTESSEKVISLYEDAECEPHFETFLKYLYTGKVTLTHTVVLPILILADKYNVEVSIMLSKLTLLK